MSYIMIIIIGEIIYSLLLKENYSYTLSLLIIFSFILN